jgi:uncharacterized membrane protein YccC
MMGAHIHEAAAVPAERHQPPLHLFGDLRIRFGIKLGLAGILALFIAQVLRLPRPNWSILTVLILMLPKYVGASAVKGAMRALGSIAGALVGIWLVGDYTSTPAIFLPLFFLIVACATYQFGKFPASQISYAYFLVGVTTIAVVTNGVLTPDQAWQIGLDRALEILVGVGSSLLVTALVWPRYARDEFGEVGSEALETVGQVFATQARIFPMKSQPDMEEMHHAFNGQLFALSNLLQAGSRESTLFSAHLSNYDSFLVHLIRLFHSASDMSRWSNGETFILDRMRGELDALENAICEEFAILAEPGVPWVRRRLSNLNEAFATFENRVREVWDLGIVSAGRTGIATEFAGQFGALRSIRDNLNGIRGAMENQPDSGQSPPEEEPRRDFFPKIDWFWVKVGIKGGLAAVIAVLLIKWINPPGAAAIPFMAWTLSVQGRSFLRAGGCGDQRVFQNGVMAAIGLVLLIVLLLLTTPFLASYAAMNLALFLILFAFGFLTARVSGLNIWMLFALITTSAFVGLNPQQPVSSETIIDTFLGVIIGVGIGAAVARLVWPVLPQRMLRQSLLALIARSQALLGGDPLRAKTQTELAILSVETLQAAQRMRMPGCSAEEKARVLTFVRTLLALVTRITGLISRRTALPEVTRSILQSKFERLDAAFGQILDGFAECFRQGDCRRELTSIRGALSEMSQAVDQIHDSQILADHELEVSLQMLDLANRYYGTADALEECRGQLRTLEIRRYWGDYAL